MIRELSINDFLYIIYAAKWTILISILSFILGGVTGFFICLFRISKIKIIRIFSQIYIGIFQGTPLLLQLFVIFFGLNIFGIDSDAWTATLVTFTLFSSAFLGEIWRGCVNSIPVQQWEASKSLGLNYFYQLIFIILPQAFKISIPPTVGFMVLTIKSTSLASLIGFTEIIRAAWHINNATYKPMIVWIFVSILYFLICFPLTKYSRYLEKKLNVSFGSNTQNRSSTMFENVL